MASKVYDEITYRINFQTSMMWAVVVMECIRISHIWQSLSLCDWRWKAAVTLGWMGATFSGIGSWPPGSTTSATLCAHSCPHSFLQSRRAWSVHECRMWKINHLLCNGSMLKFVIKCPVIWDEITFPFLNSYASIPVSVGLNYLSMLRLQCSTIQVRKWISNSIPHFTGHVITYPWWRNQ